ncbi:hypothetical protein ILUMI_10533 [Ignelater luminosus]|uniref:C2H2-type domain-containing protein n=1 Tax=Ignelater luminosus TaxID=2038154 RepID=A0A8K0CXY3_IGNLU|nr:hypothetical protein ILUMI_10533 [Ignelater luminosus]
MAHKCRKCPFLCEERDDMIQHWKSEHASTETQVLIQHGNVEFGNEQKEEVSSPCNETKLKDAEKKNGVVKCNSVNNGEIKMKSILKNNDHQTVYLCSECNFAYGTTEKLKSHMITAHKLVQRPDDNVINGGIKKSGGKEKLTAAILEKRAKASKKIKCSVKGCDLRFSIDDMRLRHEKCHVEGQKKQFKCFECDSKFSIWRVCSMHMWKCHKVDLGLFTCPMCCVFKASSAARLLRHMEIHEEERPYLCSECGKTFKQSNQLRNHQVLHNKTVANIPDWAGQQQCDICKKYFANSKSLKKHVQSVHDKFKPFICNICGHKTARKAMLDLHLRQHTGEKPHKCPICDYKTGDHNSLRRHIMRHSGDTKYSCPHCSYTSIQSVSYKNHISSKHPGLGGSYFCSLCSYHTVNENAYFNHLVDHKNGLIKDNSNGDDNKEILSKVMKLVEDKSSSNEKQSKVSEEDDESENYLKTGKTIQKIDLKYKKVMKPSPTMQEHMGNCSLMSGIELSPCNEMYEWNVH